ncbi:hypothetical protein LINGRAHAP2_LOCUS22097 [Linum grandiflorum]
MPSLVIHFDGSFVNDSNKAFFGVIVSNPAGQVIDGKVSMFYCSSSVVSEARALLEGLSYATGTHAPCHILSDCKTLVDVVHGPANRVVVDSWSCYGILGSCFV